MTDPLGDIAGAGRPEERSLVLFDWDGVLADSLEALTSVFLEACRRNGFGGLEAPGRLMSLFDDNLYASLAATGMGAEDVRRILSEFRENTLARLDEIRLFYGIAAAFYGRIAQDEAYPALSVFMQALDKIHEDYVQAPDMSKVQEGAMRGLVGALTVEGRLVVAGRDHRHVEQSGLLGAAGRAALAQAVDGHEHGVA